MMESIAATSLLRHRPICGVYHYKDVSSKQKQRNPFTLFRGRKVADTPFPKLAVNNRVFVSLIKSQALELAKETYSFKEEESIVPASFNYQYGTYVDQKPCLWPPENRADNSSLHNPLLRQERMGCGWLGAIFEWEGVLIEENADLEKQAWLALSQEEGKSPPPTFMLKRIDGMKNEQAMSEVLCWSRDPAEIRRMAKRKEEIYQALHGGIYQFRSGSQEFVDTLLHYNIPMALVSTRPRNTVEDAIGRIGISGVFNVIVAAEDVHRGKPDPEMFEYAAQNLGFIPERCIVFGNSNLTVEAAHEARMKCVAVASKHPVYELGAADLVVRRLDELSVVDLKNLADLESAEFNGPEVEMELEEEKEDDDDDDGGSMVGFDDGFW